jgi:hypothetical protein
MADEGKSDPAVPVLVGRAAEAASQDRLGEWLSADGPLPPALNGRGSPFEVTEANRIGILQIGEARTRLAAAGRGPAHSERGLSLSLVEFLPSFGRRR